MRHFGERSWPDKRQPQDSHQGQSRAATLRLINAACSREFTRPKPPCRACQSKNLECVVPSVRGQRRRRAHNNARAMRAHLGRRCCCLWASSLAGGGIDLHHSAAAIIASSGRQAAIVVGGTAAGRRGRHARRPYAAAIRGGLRPRTTLMRRNEEKRDLRRQLCY